MKTKPPTSLLVLTFLILFPYIVFAEPEVKHEYWDNGKLKEETIYEDGVRVKAYFWNESGEKWGEEVYKNGSAARSTIFWPKSGKIKEQGHYDFRSGFRVKLSGKEFYEFGRLKRATEWKFGQKVKETLFYLSGIKQSVKHFKNGKEHGIRTEWNEDGKKTFEGNFIDGNEK